MLLPNYTEQCLHCQHWHCLQSHQFSQWKRSILQFCIYVTYTVTFIAPIPLVPVTRNSSRVGFGSVCPINQNPPIFQILSVRRGLRRPEQITMSTLLRFQFWGQQCCGGKPEPGWLFPWRNTPPTMLPCQCDIGHWPQREQTKAAHFSGWKEERSDTCAYISWKTISK